MDKNFVADRLAKLRTAKGVSARDMSLSIGQGVNYINHIENRKSLPSMTAFSYICDYLGVTPGQFFDEGSTNPMLLDKVTNTLKRVDDDTLSHILAIAEKLPKQKARRRG